MAERVGGFQGTRPSGLGGVRGQEQQAPKAIQEARSPAQHKGLDESRGAPVALDKLYTQNLQQEVGKFLSPPAVEPELSTPQVFAATLRKAAASLSQAHQETGSEALGRASMLLQADNQLKQMLHMYRSLLKRG